MLAQTIGALCGRRRVRVPRQMTDGVVTLRCYRYTDLPQLYPLVHPEVVWHANGMVQHETPSFTAFCLWMLTTFPLAYVIEVGEHSRRSVGFVGIYNLTLGQHLWVSMAILQPADRRQGYGHRALSLLLANLAQHKVVDVVYADVLKTNEPSQRLCARLGFVPAGEEATRLRLVKCLR